MQADYVAFVERMISRYEGGYGWDRNDPGGPTKFGITCYDLAKYMHQVMDSMARWAPIVKAMPLATADIIYDTDYAAPMDFNALVAGSDCAIFDFGVNSGLSRSIKYSQRIVGVSQDGVMGPITLAAINNFDPMTFINHLCDARLVFLRGLPTWGDFGRGWAARVKDLRTYSLALLHPQALTLVASKVAKPQPKTHRIPKAFAKGYDPGDLPMLHHQ